MARDAPFGESLDSELSAVLRRVYARVLSDLASEVPPRKGAAVEAEVAAALITLANAGQRNAERLRRYGMYKGRQLVP